MKIEQKLTHNFRTITILCIILLCSGCNRIHPPIAQRISSEELINGTRVNDPYNWMKNQSDPKTLAYIRDENAYADHYFNGISNLKDNLFKELEDHSEYEHKQGTLPILKGDYYYYSRIPSGKKFPVHFRKLNEEKANEEKLLDENEFAKGSQQFTPVQFLPSPDNSQFLFCYIRDHVSRLIIRSCSKIEFVDSITVPVDKALWSPDGKSVLYVKEMSDVLIHKINSPVTQDIRIYHEKRSGLKIDITLSGSQKYFFIISSNEESTECSFISADMKTPKPTLIDPLKTGRRYLADHFLSNYFLVISNMTSGNHGLYKAFITSPSAANWSTVLAPSDSLEINSYTVIDQRFLLLFETKLLNARMRLVDLALGGKDNEIIFREPDGHLEFLYYDNKDHKVAFSFSSLLTPVMVYNYAIDSHHLSIHKRPSIKDYKQEDYITETIWVKSGQGNLLPVTMIHKNGAKRSDGLNPVYLEVYGNAQDQDKIIFNKDLIGLMDRGFYIANVHLGGFVGKINQLTESGNVDNNIVADYLNCAKELIQKGITAKGMITATGSYEGSQIAFNALNEHPEIFKAGLFVNSVVDIYSIKQNYPALFFRNYFSERHNNVTNSLRAVANIRFDGLGKNEVIIKTDWEENSEYYNGMVAENFAFLLDQYGIKQ